MRHNCRREPSKTALRNEIEKVLAVKYRKRHFEFIKNAFGRNIEKNLGITIIK